MHWLLTASSSQWLAAVLHRGSIYIAFGFSFIPVARVVHRIASICDHQNQQGGSLPTPSSKSGLALAARFQSFRISVPLNGVVEWVGFDHRLLGVSSQVRLGLAVTHSKR